MKKLNIRWNTMQILALGFMGVILAGGILLWLPICNTRPIAFMDALFTSTTAVCVTGLVTIVPATQFTLLGQIILALLIQIGGLGVIACGVSFFLILRRKITIKERIVIQEAYNMSGPGGMVAMIIRVVKGTFLVEGIGAVLYAIQFVPEYGMLKGIWYAVFHSISAFCNAGIDIIGDSSFLQYVGNPVINITTVLLIVFGGIGFTVWQDVITNGRRIYKNEVPKRWWFTRLSVHSKLAILTTFILIGVGTILIFLMEHDNPDTIGHLGFGEKVWASLFQAVTTRTAGFATMHQAAMNTDSQFLSCILMFIGGSPGGTAGGIKTTTFAMLILAGLCVVKGGNDTECFGRKITFANIRMGMAVVLVSMTTLFAGTMAVAALEPDTEFIRVLYETTSAVGTVGLSADLTPNLGRVSQGIIMAMMYIGRLGPISLALLFGGLARPKDRVRELPERRIMVG